MNKKPVLIGMAALGGLALLLAALAWPREQFIAAASPADYAASAANMARGAYLARAGNCMGCHTLPGGMPYAGGRLLATPFGSVAVPNITPERATGIGAWSADDFWRALHNGKGRDGRLLYPAFPYPNYTRVGRADADALYAYLRSLPAVRQAAPAHQLAFPYNTQLALAVWRLLYFKPAVYAAKAGATPEWNRGAYLVQGLGHCSACHAARNAAGASAPGLGGGMIAGIDWYAPSLDADAEAGLGEWTVDQLAALLATGISARASVVGPMADVVQGSLQHLAAADVRAMAVYLKSLPANSTTAAPPPPLDAAPTAQMAQGAALYRRYCLDCHGADGRGLPPHYPPLAGNRAVTMAAVVNPIRVVLDGGFAPGTAGNPRPYGMPPFAHAMNDGEIAAVLTYVRNSWGNRAAPLTASAVNGHRGAD